MPFAIEQKKFGFKKEGVRGVAEVAPAKYLAVAADSELEYMGVRLADNKIRGTKQEYPSAAGIKEGKGTLKSIDVEADIVGDFLFGCLGKVTSVQPDATNDPLVFRHTFVPLTDVKYPSFTFFVDRALSVKSYALTVMKKLAFAGTVDGKAELTCDLLFKTEQPAAAFTPVYNTPKPLMFFQTDIRLDGVSDQNVKSWSLDIDNGSFAQRTLMQSRDPKDILAKGAFNVAGGYDVYFETEAQRQKFLDHLPASLEIILTGDVIQGTYKSTLDILIPRAIYSAFPFGTLDGLLGAAIKFDAELDPTQTNMIQATLTNQVTGY
jgi:hypothetical protein